jgi:hypothetical protein
VECSDLSAVTVEGFFWPVGIYTGVKDCVRIYDLVFI